MEIVSKHGLDGFLEKLALTTSLFRLAAVGPGLVVSRVERNKLVKAYNGNKEKEVPRRARAPRLRKPKVVAAPSFNIIQQNINGNFQTEECAGTYIDQLLARFHPAILFLTEVDPALVEPSIRRHPEYRYIKGTLKGETNIRICALIKMTEKYEIEELNLEIPTVCIKVGAWRFVGVYREWRLAGKPETKERRDLEFLRLKTLIKWWRKQRGKTLVMGDMNFDPTQPPETPHQRTLNDIRDLMESEITDRGWKQYITEKTRFKSGDHPSLLDHVYCRDDDFIEHVFRESVTGTDHHAVGVKVRLTAAVFQATTFFARNIKGIPKGDFEKEFTTSRIHEVYQAEEVDDALGCLEFKILRTMNIVCPLRRVTTRAHYARWMTSELKLKVKRRNQMRKKAEDSMDKADWKVWKDYQKVLNKEMRDARLNFFKEEMDTKDSKKRWKVVKETAGIDGKREETIAIEIEGKVEEDPKLVARTLNEYFRDKVVNLRKDLNCSVEESLSYTEEYLKDRNIKEFEFKQVSRKYVKSVIRNLANTNAKGRDGIPTEILKKYANVLTGPIAYVVNLAIHTGKYPSLWKEGWITPLPKGGKKTDRKNWRPICINTSMSKILETVLNNQISDYMEESGVFSKTQHAYRKVRSVTSALIELDTVVKDELNKGRCIAILTTDISAGFNLVSKDILVPKMKRYGFGPNSCKLLRNYLTGRSTKVKIKSLTSPSVTLDTGVGEGSVLGPNFFSCGMTDISIVAKRVTKYLKDFYKIDAFLTQIEYADDTTGIISCETERELQIAVDELLKGFGKFYSANGLKLNESKCHVLVVRSQKKTMTITCAGQNEEESLRLLGLFIDNKLQYDVHTRKIVGRLTDKIGSLENLKKKASFKTHKEVTVSLVHSTIEFCAEIYLRTHQNQSKIQKKLNVAMRMLLDREVDSPVADMMASLEWLNVANMWRWCSVRTLRRIMDHPGMTPHLWSLLDLNINPRYETRYQAFKTKWKKHTRWARESFLFTVLDTYNELRIRGRYFEDYEHMRDTVKELIKTEFGNQNIK